MEPTEGALDRKASSTMAKRMSTGNWGTKLSQGTKQSDLVSGGGNSGKKSKTATPAVRSSLLTNNVTSSRHGQNTDDEETGVNPLHVVETPFSAIGPRRLHAGMSLGKTAKTDAQAVLHDHQASQLALFRKAVQTGLFPKVKFITTAAMLDYGHKVAEAVMNRLDILDGDDVKKGYWEVHRNLVNRALNAKRCKVNNEMKKEFMSKCVTLYE